MLTLLLCIWTMAAASVVAAQSSQQVGQDWRLTLTVSGGFAGLHREFTLESSGIATAFDRGRSLQIRRQASREELLEIGRLAGSVASAEMENDGFCRDCLTYAIDLRVPGRVVTIRANDITLSSSKAAPLLQAVLRVQQRLLDEQ